MSSSLLTIVQATARAKFSETVELQLVLGTDPKRGDHAVRGTATLPHGTGKPVRVAVFAEGSSADAARAAGDHWFSQAWTGAQWAERATVVPAPS
jgi:large subunit ribosomal protein L1